MNYLINIKTYHYYLMEKKLVTSIEDKEKYVIHIAALKKTLNHGLLLKKARRVIEFI